MGSPTHIVVTAFGLAALAGCGGQLKMFDRAEVKLAKPKEQAAIVAPPADVPAQAPVIPPGGGPAGERPKEVLTGTLAARRFVLQTGQSLQLRLGPELVGDAPIVSLRNTTADVELGARLDVSEEWRREILDRTVECRADSDGARWLSFERPSGFERRTLTYGKNVIAVFAEGGTVDRSATIEVTVRDFPVLDATGLVPAGEGAPGLQLWSSSFGAPAAAADGGGGMLLLGGPGMLGQ